MFDFNTLADFSRTHCIAICTFLVPANLLATIAIIVLTALSRPQVQVGRVAAIGNICALVMVSHVFTWFASGVVMPPTYILLVMASTCLSINLWAVAHPTSMRRLLKTLLTWLNYAKTTQMPPIS